MMIPGDLFTFKPGILGPPLSEENCSLSPSPINLPREHWLTSAETGAWQMAFILLRTWSPLPFMASRPTTRARTHHSVSRYIQVLFCEVTGYTTKELGLCIKCKSESWEWQTTGQSGRREKDSDWYEGTHLGLRIQWADNTPETNPSTTLSWLLGTWAHWRPTMGCRHSNFPGIVLRQKAQRGGTVKMDLLCKTWHSAIWLNSLGELKGHFLQ